MKKIPMFRLPKDWEWMPQQVGGSEYIAARNRAALILPTGQGKCLTTLRAYDKIRGPDLPHLLVTCPKNALGAWADDIQDYCNLMAVFYPGNIYGHDIIVVPHSRLVKFIAEVGTTFLQKCVLAIDEIDMFVNDEASNHQQLMLIAASTTIAWGLTATPIHNNLENTYNWINALYAGRSPLGTFDSFCGTYIKYRDRKIRVRGGGQRIIKEQIGVKNMDRLKKIMDSFIFKSETKVDISFKYLKCKFSINEEKEYSQRAREILKSGSPAAHIPSLQKLTDGVYSDGIHSKLDLFKRAISDIVERGNPFIVFCAYHDTRRLLKPIIQSYGVKVHEIHGEKDTEHRRAVAHHIREKGGNQCVLMTKAGIRGANLQFCESTIVYDTPTEVKDLTQLLGRQARLGSPFKKWWVFFLAVQNTIDDYKMSYIVSNADVVRQVVGGTAVLPQSSSTVTREDIIKLRKSLIWRQTSTPPSRGRSLRL